MLQKLVNLLLLLCAPKSMAVCEWRPATVPNDRLVGALSNTSEGVTTNGEILFFNGVSNIWVANQTLDVIQHRGNVIPSSFRAAGYRHMGDTAYYSGFGINSSHPVILGAISGYPNVTVKPAVIAFDAFNLSTSGWSCELEGQVLSPWVAVGEEATSTLLLSSNYYEANHINLYKISPSGCTLLRSVAMNRTIWGAQGGTLLNGTLYVGGNAAKVYAVDLSTGGTTVAIHRPLDFEMEGVVALDMRQSGRGMLHFYNGDALLTALVPRTMWHYDYVCS